MKNVIFSYLALTIFCLQSIQAEESRLSNGEFESAKSTAIAMVDERIEAMNKLKACLTATSKPDDLKNCRKEHKEAMKGLRLEARNMRMEHMKKRRDAIDQRLKDMESKNPDEKK